VDEPVEDPDLLADGRCSQAVLDFPSFTDVGRRVSAEEDTVSEVSGAELREWVQEAEAEELGAGGTTTVFAHA